LQNLATLLMQMERIESEVNSRLQGLGDKVVRGAAGAGLVTAIGDVFFNIQRIQIDREKLAQKTYDLSTLEALIAEAVNNAIKEARRLLRTEIGGVFGGEVPPGFTGFFGRSGNDVK